VSDERDGQDRTDVLEGAQPAPRPARRGAFARPGVTVDPGVESEMRTLRDRQTGRLMGKKSGARLERERAQRQAQTQRNRIIREAEKVGEIPDLTLLPRAPRRPTPLPVALSEDVEPWERQPRESGRAYACFIVFRDLGPFDRSIRRAAKDLGVGRTVPQRMAIQWRWDERAAAWDSRRQAEFDETRKGEQEKAVRSHANATRALIGQCMRLLQSQQDKSVPDGRVLRDIALSMDKAIHHQRLALGLPTEMSRQDIYLKGIIAEMERNHTEILGILEEVLCDDCRDATRTKILEIKRREQAAQRKIS
jgi:hypothetical protein